MTDTVEKKEQVARSNHDSRNNNDKKKRKSRGIAQSVGTILLDVIKFLTDRPLTLCMTGLFVLVNIAMRIAWDASIIGPKYDSVISPFSKVNKFPGEFFNVTLRDLHGYGWARSLGTIFIVNTVTGLVVGVFVIIALFGVAESKLGWLKALTVSVVSTTIGLSSAFGLYFAAYSGTHRWVALSRFPLNYGITVLVIGAFMAASSTMNALWQRRISIVIYAVMVTLILYRGAFIDYAIILSAFIGHMLGYMISSNNLSQVVSAYRYIGVVERRRILTVVYTVFATGPLVAAFSRVHAGPLSSLGMLLSADSVSASHHITCENNSLGADCLIFHRALGADRVLSMTLSIMLLLVMLTIAWGLLRGLRVAAWSAIVLNAMIALTTSGFYIFLPLTRDTAVDVSFAERIKFVVSNGGLFNLALMAIMTIGFIIAIVVNFESFPYTTNRSRLINGGGIIGFSAVTLIGLCIMLSSDSVKWSTSFGRIVLDCIALCLNILLHFFPMGFLRQTWGMEHGVLNSSTGIWMIQLSGLIFWLIVEGVFLRWFSAVTASKNEQSAHVDAVLRKGGESMSFMATWDGNRYWYSKDGNTAIAYRVYLNIAIAVTGAFGTPSAYEQALKEFTQFCEEHGWTPVMYSVHNNQREILENWGWNSLDVGTEMIINPREWKTTGKKWQDIRTAINKAKREGITDVLSTFKAEPIEIRQQIMDISEEWTEEKALPEMRFTLGGVEELMDERVKILYAIDEQGVVQAVTSWMPTYRDGVIVGWTLDFMRHRDNSMKGIMEYLIARMAERLHDDENSTVEFLSLSAAPLSGMAVHDGQSELLSHTLELVGKLLEPAYGFSSLFFFKKKFQPQEDHVFIVYPDSAKLLQVSLAISHAYLPQISASDLITLLKIMRG